MKTEYRQTQNSLTIADYIRFMYKISKPHKTLKKEQTISYWIQNNF